MKTILFVFALLVSFRAASHSTETLKYDPVVVTLRGILSLQDFAGPPNYENVKQGDRLERYWILSLKKPVRVVASPGEELFYTQEDVREIQLICLEECGKSFSFNIGRDMTLTGTLLSAHSGHHHKDVLMNVQKAR